MLQKYQASESFRVGVLLAVTGGFLDAYSYLARGGVFANAATGNIVLLALNLAQGDFGRVLHYLIPIAAYAAGIIAAELIRRRFGGRDDHMLHWRQLSIAAEIIIVCAVAFFPQGTADLAAVSAISFVCSMQVESFRKVQGNPYATTMCTGNLRSASEHLYRRIFGKDKQSGRTALLYFGIIGAFMLGAIAGGAAVIYLQEKACLVCGVFLLAAILFMLKKKEEA
ncbi:MAG: DUF1275 domain-containing protein [Eubacterium sp.]|nr:DUF1275 domain-containing protein [Eubacterium sp.]